MEASAITKNSGAIVICKDCGGGSICEHKRVRSKCINFDSGSSICQHQRNRSKCKDCGGGGICEHQRRRTTCKDCGSGGFCGHRMHQMHRMHRMHRMHPMFNDRGAGVKDCRKVKDETTEKKTAGKVRKRGGQRTKQQIICKTIIKISLMCLIVPALLFACKICPNLINLPYDYSMYAVATRLLFTWKEGLGEQTFYLMLFL